MIKKKTMNSLNYSKNQTVVYQNKKTHSIPELIEKKDNASSIHQKETEQNCVSKLANINFKLAMAECFILLQQVSKK